MRLLQKQFKKVAVIDVDYHAGNGTMSIFWNDETVFVASLHADPDFDYPFNFGFANQIGGKKALHTKMNVPLKGGIRWKEYKQELMKVMKKVKLFKPQALVVSLGLDTLENDPVAFPNCRFQITPNDFEDMGDILLHGDIKLPTVVIQDGGYFLDNVPSAVVSFLKVKKKANL